LSNLKSPECIADSNTLQTALPSGGNAFQIVLKPNRHHGSGCKIMLSFIVRGIAAKMRDAPSR
jgi:hypothetical protein